MICILRLYCLRVIIRLIDYLLDLYVLLIEEVIVVRHNSLAVILHYYLTRDVHEVHLMRCGHPWLRLMIDTLSLIIELDGVMSHLKGVWGLAIEDRL